MWTHGYNIYTRDRLILFPLYKSKTIKNHAAKTHFIDHQDWLEMNRLSMVHVHMLLNTLKKAPEKLHPSPDDVVELEKGDHRTLAEYGLWAGIYFANQSINSKALSAQFPAGQAC